MPISLTLRLRTSTRNSPRPTRRRGRAATNLLPSSGFYGLYSHCMQRNVELEATIVARYTVVSRLLDERSRRRWATAESWCRRPRVWSGRRSGRDVRKSCEAEAPTDRVRCPGAGRPRLEQSRPSLLAALEAPVDPLTHGDQTLPLLRWTCKSRAKLDATLTVTKEQMDAIALARDAFHRGNGIANCYPDEGW